MPDIAPRSAPVLPWTHMPWAMQRPALHQFLRTAAAVDPATTRATIEAAAEIAPTPVAAGGAGARDAEVPAVALLSLVGPITPWPTFSFFGGGSAGLMGFRSDLAAAVADPNIKAIVIDVDSPGGLVSLVPETSAEILAAREVKPVIAVANTLAASAAYWLASQASELVVTPSGVVGSVGVYVLHENYAGFNERVGIDPTFIFAESSPRKVDGNMEEPLSDQARADIQDDVDAICTEFIAAVAAGRGIDVAKVEADFGQGRTLRADKALAAGMVDRIATLEQVISDAASKAAGSAPSALGGGPAFARAAALRDATRAALAGGSESEPQDQEPDPESVDPAAPDAASEAAELSDAERAIAAELLLS